MVGKRPNKKKQIKNKQKQNKKTNKHFFQNKEIEI
jgi:hypothetical protein